MPKKLLLPPHLHCLANQAPSLQELIWTMMILVMQIISRRLLEADLMLQQLLLQWSNQETSLVKTPTPRARSKLKKFSPSKGQEAQGQESQRVLKSWIGDTDQNCARRSQSAWNTTTPLSKDGSSLENQVQMEIDESTTYCTVPVDTVKRIMIQLHVYSLYHSC